jgi:hypothetical protein
MGVALSFGMILGIALLLMVSLVLSAAISALGKWWGGARSFGSMRHLPSPPAPTATGSAGGIPTAGA